MASRKLLLGAAALAAATVAGCASDPYTYSDNYYYDRPAYTYYDSPYRYYSNAPRYYVAPPTMSFGLTYSDRRYHPGHRWPG